MEEKSLHEFYQYVILPQYGFIGSSFEWVKCESFDYDGEAHYFTHQNDNYVLLFKDYGGVEESEIEDVLGIKVDKVKYLNLKHSASKEKFIWFGTTNSPSQYAHNITGTYTLIEIIN